MELQLDPIYQFVSGHTLPICRENESVKKFLSDYYQAYIHDLDECLGNKEKRVLPDTIYELIKDSLPIVKNCSKSIIDFLDEIDKGRRQNSLNVFNEMMDNIIEFLPIKKLSSKVSDRFHTYYRIRSTNVSDRKELFHIPISKRHLVGGYRYSVPGHPCLYLANGMELCFFECDMPKEFSCAKFQLDLDESTIIRFLDFSKDEREIITDISIWLHNNPNDRNDIEKYFRNFIVTFPLRVACSLSVKNRNVNFVEEYVVPQQLTSWIVEHGELDGILYETCSDKKTARYWKAVNLVVPTRDCTVEYCSNLKKMFSISKPVFVKVSEKIVGGIYQIEPVNKVLNAINNLRLSGKTLTAYSTIESLCQSFLMIISSLSNDNYRNPECTILCGHLRA